MRIKIDGEILRVTEIDDGGSYGLPTIEVEDGRKYIVCSFDQATEYVRDKWLDLARQDPKEFTALIGEDRLVKWALGQSDEYGISSLQEFAERSGEYAEEELALCDGIAVAVNRAGRLLKELGVPNSIDLVAFRIE